MHQTSVECIFQNFHFGMCKHPKMKATLKGSDPYPDTLSKARVFDVRRSPNIACDTHIAAQQGVITLRLASMQQ